MLPDLPASDFGRLPILIGEIFRPRRASFALENGCCDQRQRGGFENNQFADEHAVRRIRRHDDELVGHQRLRSTARPRHFTLALDDMRRVRRPRGLRALDFMRCPPMSGIQDFRRDPDEPFLKLFAIFFGWAMARCADKMTVAIDGRLTPLRCSCDLISRSERGALRLSSHRETLRSPHEARRCGPLVLKQRALAVAA